MVGDVGATRRQSRDNWSHRYIAARLVYFITCFSVLQIRDYPECRMGPIFRCLAGTTGVGVKDRELLWLIMTSRRVAMIDR